MIEQSEQTVTKTDNTGRSQMGAEKRWHNKANEIITLIASFETDQECRTHGPICDGDKDDCELFNMSSDDAVETLRSLITRARGLMADRPW